MATLTVSDPNGNSLPFVAAASGGDEYPNDKDTVLLIDNGGGGAVTATVAAQKTKLFVPGVGECTVSDIAPVIPAAGIAAIHASNATHNNDATGRAAITYSGVVSVTVVPVRLLRLG